MTYKHTINRGEKIIWVIEAVNNITQTEYLIIDDEGYVEVTRHLKLANRYSTVKEAKYDVLKLRLDDDYDLIYVEYKGVQNEI